MCRLECVCDLNRELKQFIGVQWPAGNQFLERLPVQVLHDHERVPFVLSYFVDGADIGMVQRTGRPAFTVEPAQRIRIVGKVPGQEL
jgi:hypothetical protein